MVPSTALSHKVVCNPSCGNGYCLGDNICVCDEGYGGPLCDQVMTTCSNVNSASLVSGGVNSQYFRGLYYDNLILSKIEPSISFQWDSTKPAPDFDTYNPFSAIFRGYIRVPTTGWYNFALQVSDQNWDRFSVFIGRRQMIWPAGYDYRIPFFMFSNITYDFVVTYQDAGWTDIFVLKWQVPGTSSLVAVPSSNLYYYNEQCGCPSGSNSLECSGIGNGVCQNGFCMCNGTFTGAACDKLTCRADECFGADNCYIPSKSSQYSECNGKGTCNNGQCQCNSGFANITNCILQIDPLCPENVDICSGHGTCYGGQCTCDAGYYGLNCSFQSCLSSQAYKPGLRAQFFKDFNGEALYSTGAERRLDMAYETWGSSNQPVPGLPNSFWRAVYTGFLTPFFSGEYNLWCRNSGGYWVDVCNVFLNGTLLTSTTNVVLSAGVHYRLKVIVAAQYDPTYAFLLWKPSNNDTFTFVPDYMLSYYVTCSSPCVHGCCDNDNQCRCLPGYTGADCSIPIVNCTGLPYLSLKQGGLLQRVYNDRVFLSLTSQTVIPALSYIGSTSSTSRTWSGALRADRTGWHSLRLVAPGYDRGVRLWMDGELLFDYTTSFARQKHLVAGQYYNLLAEVYGEATVSFSWQQPNSFIQIVPSNNLYYYDQECTCPINPTNGLVCGGRNQGGKI